MGREVEKGRVGDGKERGEREGEMGRRREGDRMK